MTGPWWNCGKELVPGSVEVRTIDGNAVRMHKVCAKHFDEHKPFTATIPPSLARRDDFAPPEPPQLRPEKPLDFN